MKRALVAAAASLFVASSAEAGQREDVAKRWAPVFEQEIRDGKDLLTAFDFDGNWAGDDNDENLAACLDGSTSCDLSAKVYFTVIETSTHWFVQYLPYHATDAKMTNGHEHDTESVFAYCHNPYVGIVDQCAKPQSIDPTAPTTPGSETKPSDPSGAAGSGESDDATQANADAGETGCSTTRARADASSAVLAAVAGVIALRRRRRAE